jgi:hypothetical protein
MKIEITAGGIFGAEGEIPVGTVIEVKSEPKGWAGRYRVVSDGKGKTAVINPAAGYAVTEKSPGWYVVTKDGEPVTKAMRKTDLEGFETMSDEDKEAFVELQKPEA